MLYLILLNTNLLLILIISILQTCKKKKLNGFFIFLKINFILFFKKINFTLFLFLVILLTLSNTLNIIYDIIQNINYSAHCAGVPKLVELAYNELYPDQTYVQNKIIFKYNFSMLKRNNNFYENRSTIVELSNICQELNLIYNHNVSIFKTILSTEHILALKTEKDVQLMLERINNYYDENVFKRENLKLINSKLGIPLYNDLYNKAYRIYIPYCFKDLLTKDIALYNIKPFMGLITDELTKNVNYFNVDLDFNINGCLISPKQNLTIDAIIIEKDVIVTDNHIPVMVTDRIGTNRKLSYNHEVYSDIITDTGEKKLVLDVVVVPEPANGAEKPDVLIGGLGIIESYVHYTKCMSETVKLLNLSNTKLENLIELLSNPNFKNNEEPFNENILNFSSFYKSRIIEETVIMDSRNIFKDDNFHVNQNISSRFNKIDSTFFKQLNKNTSMLRDIHNQQSGMHVNYTELIKVMENPSEVDKNYFSTTIKNKILRASKGDFSYKRPRS